MGKPILIAAFVAFVLSAMSPGWCAFLETDPETTTGDTERIMSPEPPANEITRLVGRVRVGRPITTRNMMVFPLTVAGGTDPTSYVTLDDAVARGLLKIREKGEGRVQEVVVRNTSRHYVFLMAGEIVSGAKQNRVITTDVLLRPHGPDVAVPVYCVERGRWAGRSMDFSTEKSFANFNLRNIAQSKAGQAEVWDEVKRVSKLAGVESDTSNFQDVVNDKEVKAALDEYGKIMPRPPERCIGAAIAINNSIVGVELFANETLFSELWPKLRRGYALDAYPLFDEYTKTRWLRMIDERDVRAFLNRVHRASFRRHAGIDLGTMYTISGNALGGEGLVFESNVIHVNFAPPRHVIMPRRDPIILEERQDASTTEDTEDTE